MPSLLATVFPLAATTIDTDNPLIIIAAIVFILACIVIIVNGVRR